MNGVPCEALSSKMKFKRNNKKTNETNSMDLNWKNRKWITS